MIEVRIDRIPDKEWSYREDKGIPRCYWYIDEKNLYEYIEVIRFLEVQSKDQEQKKRLFRKVKTETRRIKTKKFYKKIWEREEFNINTGELIGVKGNPFPDEVWQLIREKYVHKEKIYRDDEKPELSDERHTAGRWIWEIDKKY